MFGIFKPDFYKQVTVGNPCGLYCQSTNLDNTKELEIVGHTLKKKRDDTMAWNSEDKMRHGRPKQSWRRVASVR